MAHDWIVTYTGKQFYPLAPRVEDICIEDIAHALSNICRFTGHVRTFYSVGEHSLRACYQAPPFLKLALLLHDAYEAYMCDLSRPVKHAEGMAYYRQAEDRGMAAISDRFEVFFMDPLIHTIDDRMLMTERRDLMPYTEGIWSTQHAPAYPERIVPYPPKEVEYMFLKQFRILTA